jgi:ankyrin repeat protein
MNILPVSPDIHHLKKQAMDLLRDALNGEPSALLRFAQSLPAVHGIAPADLVHRELKLHDAHSVLAREYGFLSWTELSRYVAWKQSEREERLKQWANWVYREQARERRLAMRMLREEPELFARPALLKEPWIACATGDVDVLRELMNSATAAEWVKKPVGPLQMLPLVAVTHSQLIHEPGFEAGMLGCVALLLENGADPDSSWMSPDWEENPLSALYGAAGRAYNAAMTRMLLEAGANPDDNESLYHSCEGADAEITRLLLDAGATVNGTNALGRVLDFDKPELLRAMIEHGGNVNEKPWMHHAILRGRSTEHMRILVEAGTDLHAADASGTSLFRFAQLHGREDVLTLLKEAGVSEELTMEDCFVAACARGDEPAARAVLREVPNLLELLTQHQLETMPQLAAVGQIAGVRTMLAVGWPREVRFGWGATALNHGVFRGDAEMAELLLEAGADWRTEHGFKDNVLGTLSWASNNAANGADGPAIGDFAGCTQALLKHGVPLAAFEGYSFSPEVERVLDAARLLG